ncbi:hypothetical protein [Methylobacterium mesophilicum]|uniref:hypothetical protein n=1 Tax=Methylobacterium mesophilicum TaxID=39956 RepID=UPI001EE34D37|nr:hypothetical protein [Methylobacterium mesophilicum]
MIVLDPISGRQVEIVVPPRAPTPRLQERAEAKAARIQAKAEAQRAAAWSAMQQAELNESAL